MSHTFERCLMKVARPHIDSLGFHSKDEWEKLKLYTMASRFKREFIGPFRREGIRSKKEMSVLLRKFGMPSSGWDFDTFLPSLNGLKIDYSPRRYFQLEVVENASGEEAYRLRVLKKAEEDGSSGSSFKRFLSKYL